MADKRIIIPENIGTSIKLNFKTEGKYDVNVKAPLNIATNGEVGISLSSEHFSVDSRGNLTASPLATALRTEIQNNKPQLSKTPGNLLQEYSDGLYYGITAPANVSNLYVDAVNGIDQDPNVVKGAGSRANPLRTISYALGLVPERTSTTIFLHEQQDHVISERKTFNLSKIIFRTYGPRCDELLKTPTINGDSYLLFLNNPEVRAQIVLRGIWVLTNNSSSRTYNYVSLYCITFNDTAIEFFGVDLVNDFNSSQSGEIGMLDLGLRNTPNDASGITEIPFRIIARKCAISFNRSSIKSRGTPNIVISPNHKTGVNEENALLRKDGNNLWKMAHFYLHNSQITTTHATFDAENYIVGPVGWSEDNSGTNSYQINHNLAAFAKRISGVVIGNGVVQSPSMNVPASYFN